MCRVMYLHDIISDMFLHVIVTDVDIPVWVSLIFKEWQSVCNVCDLTPGGEKLRYVCNLQCFKV